MKTLYFDCFSGAAGDMLLGALLDVDADLAFVRDQLERLEFSGWQLDVVPVTRAGIRATQARVEVDPDQPARDYPEIRRLLKSSELHPDVRAIAERVFEALARAEARVHGVELDRVHLHEVAAVDAFVDIVGTAAALASLRAERIVASPLPLGGGTTRSAHGPLPVPPPAVAELLAGVPVRGGGDRELVTPTGAAILVTVADSFGDLPPMRLERTGYGAGSADLATPNVVRVIVGESVERHERTALLIETNIDDMPPELVPRVLERLIGAGAHDAWTTSILMKKGRPALAISCLAPDHERDRILDVLYAETTTFGVRMLPVTKDELERAWIEVEVEGHPVRVKQGIRGGSVVTQSPEYEDAVKVANATGLPLKDVYRLATQAAARRAGAR